MKESMFPFTQECLKDIRAGLTFGMAEKAASGFLLMVVMPFCFVFDLILLPFIGLACLYEYLCDR